MFATNLPINKPKMYKLLTIIIQFENEIEAKAIPFFRGAVIASLDEKNILFHNHDEDKLRYSYPSSNTNSSIRKQQSWVSGKESKLSANF